MLSLRKKEKRLLLSRRRRGEGRERERERKKKKKGVFFYFLLFEVRNKGKNFLVFKHSLKLTLVQINFFCFLIKNNLILYYNIYSGIKVKGCKSYLKLHE